MLRVEVDGIIFALQNIGGISIYHSELLKSAGPDVAYLVGLPRGSKINAKLLTQDNGAEVPRFAQRHYPTRSLERIRRYHTDVSFDAQVVHTSYYRCPARRQVPLVVTAHDFIVEAFGPRSLRQHLHVIQKRKALSRATQIIAISESTRDDLERLHGPRIAEKVTVVHNGASDAFHPLPGVQRTFSSLFVGSRASYKGFEIAVDIAAKMAEMRLTIVGGGPLSSSEQNLLETRLPGRFEHLGFLSQAKLVTAYNRASFLLYPSSYEGFGIPPIEAARCGCIPVVFHTSSLPEVVSTTETIFPLNATASDIAAALSAFSTGELEQLRERGIAFSEQFTWRKCATETEQVLRAAAG